MLTIFNILQIIPSREFATQDMITLQKTLRMQKVVVWRKVSYWLSPRYVQGWPTISLETLYFVNWESADEMGKQILCSNERYIQELQNDTKNALVLWVILIFYPYEKVEKKLSEPVHLEEVPELCNFNVQFGSHQSKVI